MHARIAALLSWGAKQLQTASHRYHTMLFLSVADFRQGNWDNAGESSISEIVC